MCIGEKRTLTIGPSYGYGDRNIGPIPAGSTLGASLLFEHWALSTALHLTNLFILGSFRNRDDGH